MGVSLLLLVLTRNGVIQQEDSGLPFPSMDQSEPGCSIDIHTKTVSHNLPRRSSPFFGRENNITNLTKLLLKQNRIININGPPAFGKSSLAIKLGWHLIENYSTVFKEVRYIDTATTKQSIYLCSNYQNEQSWPKQNTVKSVITLKDTESQAPHESNVEPNLCEWFKTRKEKTLLILDNCDSFLQGSVEKQEFFYLITSQLDHCDDNKLSIVITSQEQLEFLDDCFQSFQITELDPADSVNMLRHHVPTLNDEMAHNFSSLVGHCPLALKVVGRMLAARGIENMETLLHSLEDKIVSTISNKISDSKERFKAIMDLAYTNLDIESQECSSIVSFFPSTFERTIGTEILSGIVDSECVENIAQKSFVEEFFIANKTRYTMHKLIRSYFKEERSKDSFYELNQKQFRANFITCYSNYVLKILKDRYKFKNITDEDVHKMFYLENENLKHFERALNLTRNNLTDESVLAFSLLIIENLSFFSQDFVFPHYVDDHSLYIKLCQFSSTDICSRFMWKLLVKHYKLNGQKVIRFGIVAHFYLQLVSYIKFKENIFDIYSCKNLTFLTYGDALSYVTKHVEQSGSNEEKDLLLIIENTVFFCKNDWIVHSIKLILSVARRLLYLLIYLVLIILFVWLKKSFKENVMIMKKHFLLFWLLNWLENSRIHERDALKDVQQDFSLVVIFIILFLLIFSLLGKFSKSGFSLCFINVLIPICFHATSGCMHLYCFHLATSLSEQFFWTFILMRKKKVAREEPEPHQEKFSDIVFHLVVHFVIIVMIFYLLYYVIKFFGWFSNPAIVSDIVPTY